MAVRRMNQRTTHHEDAGTITLEAGQIAVEAAIVGFLHHGGGRDLEPADHDGAASGPNPRAACGGAEQRRIRFRAEDRHNAARLVAPHAERGRELRAVLVGPRVAALEPRVVVALEMPEAAIAGRTR